MKYDWFDSILTFKIARRHFNSSFNSFYSSDSLTLERMVELFTHKKSKESEILDNILEAVGSTPLVRLHKIPQIYNLECDLCTFHVYTFSLTNGVVVKCEFFNPGGSIKDRIAKRMIEDAEKNGMIHPGRSTIIEPTSGNTGIGLALVSLIKGYKVIITIPEKMSQEKIRLLKALGAEIYRTPTEVPFDSPESHISLAKRLHESIPDSIILDQYSNPSNPQVHYDNTAQEILDATNNGKNLHMIVIGAGTGGTLTGVARKLKEQAPHVKIVAVDPIGSILAPKDKSLSQKGGTYKVEGIGYDFIPDTLNQNAADLWMKISDQESFDMARQLIREEGLLCGGSSGSAMSGAIKAAKSLKKGDVCVVVLPDSIRNYMSKFLSDEWMVSNGLLKDPEIYRLKSIDHSHWKENRICDVLPLKKSLYFDKHISVKTALLTMHYQNMEALPILDFSDQYKLEGVVFMNDLYSYYVQSFARPSSKTTTVIELMKNLKTLKEEGKVLSKNSSVHQLLVSFDKSDTVIITKGEHEDQLMGLVNKSDMVHLLYALNEEE